METARQTPGQFLKGTIIDLRSSGGVRLVTTEFNAFELYDSCRKSINPSQTFIDKVLSKSGMPSFELVYSEFTYQFDQVLALVCDGFLTSRFSISELMELFNQPMYRDVKFPLHDLFMMNALAANLDNYPVYCEFSVREFIDRNVDDMVTSTVGLYRLYHNLTVRS